jgi:SUMO ligase MMS21 Smc5/6 complex component
MIFEHNRKIDFMRSIKVFDHIWSTSMIKWSFLPLFSVDDAEKANEDESYVAKYIIYANIFKMMEICKVHREEFPVVSRCVWHPYERDYIYMEDDEIDAMFDSSSDSEYSEEEYHVDDQEEGHVEVGVYE